MAAMSPEQQVPTIFQQEMAQTRTHVAQLADSYEVLKSAHDALSLAAQQALGEKEQKIQKSENRLWGLIFRQQFNLLDSKELRPDHFHGRATEPFKPWQRKFKAFCNSKRTGFRGALEWAETQPTENLDSTQVPWDHAEAAAPKLQDLLLQILDENALLLVDKPGLADAELVVPLNRVMMHRLLLQLLLLLMSKLLQLLKSAASSAAIAA